MPGESGALLLARPNQHLTNRIGYCFNFAESEQHQQELKQRKKQTEREQANKSTRWMPWRLKPKKDAETGETFKGSCMQAKNLENPNGATHPE